MEKSRYAIAAVRERVREHDGEVIDFSVGRFQDELPGSLRELLDENRSRLLISGCSEGELEEFSERAAAMLERVYGLSVSPGAVLPVPGGRTAMSFLGSTLIRPGDRVVTTEPSYPAFNRVALQLGARITALVLDPGNGFAPSLESLSDEVAAETILVTLNYPNNPTGAAISGDALDALLARFGSDTIVFNDATYGPLTFDLEPWSLLAQPAAIGREQRIVELHSIAKVFAVDPVPVSFLVGDRELMDELREYSEFAWSDQSSFALRIGIHCLDGDSHLEAVRATYRERLDRLRSTLNELGFETFPTSAGMYVFCRRPSSLDGVGVSSAAECADLLLERFGVAVVPFDVPPEGYLRFSARYLAEDLDALAGLGRDGPIAAG
jgi:aspartate/methionine/tyrosine aminotransferase